MAKLNYINRKVSGTKLGATIKKDVLKHSQSSLNTKKSVTKDPHIEINLPGKDLGDDGLKLACEGLVQALEEGGVKLDELNLAENNLTVAGLVHLAEVVKRSSRDLKDLELRGNDLRIVTVEDAYHWESFLHSFKDVSSLRRVDISDNPIGDRGFELLWRVYTREPRLLLPMISKGDSHVDLNEGYDSDGREAGELVEDDEELFTQARDLSISDMDVSSPPEIEEGILKSRTSSQSSNTSTGVELHGLRSVPYYILSRTSVTDNAALFLSYVVSEHPNPESLMIYHPAAKAGAQADMLKQYNHMDGCSGIIYRPNDGMTSSGDRVLDSAEVARGCYMSRAGRRFSEAPMDSQTTPLKTRRESIIFSNSPPSPRDQLEKARSKIQGSILRESGPHQVELWSVTFKMLALSRTILFDPKYDPKKAETKSSPTRCSRRSFSAISGSIFQKDSSSINESQNGSRNDSQAFPSPQQSPVRVFSSPVACQGLWPVPSTPVKHQPASAAGPVSPVSPAASAPSPVSKPRSQEAEHILPCGFPEDVWRCIISSTADPNGLLSVRQQCNIVEFARTHDTLDRERELAGQMKSKQLWRALEELGCLAYDASS